MLDTNRLPFNNINTITFICIVQEEEDGAVPNRIVNQIQVVLTE